MKIIAVCGMGIGTSVLLKMNAEKVLRQLEIDATVEAASVETARNNVDAQIVLTTPDLLPLLAGIKSEVISIDHFFDLEEITAKLSKALL
ncbi:PTS sugar transporter subunit IIB [Candidatus Rhodoluna planktonica]|uniref:PTS ascorbate transporter subunit IIB n=1 Tax=Candidatus Rhodoluna planktonica TaxID=535712 RepID=A0A1D9E015_9MICO|nr:PTS sugar transporter subunit IIB [Candidatus Rhodoluna planktonica]AOY56403.1 PTS ascorbate transporter subunit IIB [Candidatus Rhodoluna planktonica]